MVIRKEPKDAPNPIVNKGDNSSPYPFHYVKVDGDVVVFFNGETMEPVCWVPDSVLAWTGIYRNAWLVRKLAANGLSRREIKKAVTVDYREYRTAHLRDGVYLKTLKENLDRVLDWEEAGTNWRPDKALEVKGHPELVAFAFDPTPKNGKRR